jgi:uncharacterized membrane protein YqjE
MASPSRSVPQVLQDIVGNIQEIIRSEARLAKAELRDKAEKATAPAKTLVVGAAFGLYAMGFLLFTAVMGLATIVATWMAALIVGVALAIIATALMGSAIARLKRINAAPEKTVESLKEDVQWAKDQIR